jgi:cytochrome c
MAAGPRSGLLEDIASPFRRPARDRRGDSAEGQPRVAADGMPIAAAPVHARSSSDARAGACAACVGRPAFPVHDGGLLREGLAMLVRPPLLLSMALLAASGAHAQDAAAGGMAFQQCAECHSPSNADGAGPGLKDVVGRRAGSKPGFVYSSAMKKATVVWDAATLDAFLADPRAVVPGTTMAYAGDDDAKERADLVAYLKTLK